MATDFARIATEERSDLAAFLETLTFTDWAHPSLCTEWCVRDVVAHVLSYEELSAAGVAAAFLRGRFSPERINIQRLAVYGNHGPEQLLALLRSHLEPRGFTSWFGGGIGLSDCLIHHQDIRRALKRPRSIPPERLRPVLDIALKAPVLPARRNAKGLRFVATDFDWSTGTGPEISGPAEAVLLALAGRPDALDDLSGPGASTLRSRLDAATQTPSGRNADGERDVDSGQVV